VSKTVYFILFYFMQDVHTAQVETPQPPPIAEFAAKYLSTENPLEKLRRAELAAGILLAVNPP